MPPRDNNGNLGWKAFFAAMAVINVLGAGIGWRIYDTVSENREIIVEVKTVQEKVILQRLEDLEENSKK